MYMMNERNKSIKCVELEVEPQITFQLTLEITLQSLYTTDQAQREPEIHNRIFLKIVELPNHIHSS